MKYTNHTLLLNCALLGLSLLSMNAYAEDRTESALGNCELIPVYDPNNPWNPWVTGNGTNLPYGIKVNSSAANISCHINKKVGSNTLKKVLVRLYKGTEGGNPPICMVSSQDQLGQGANYGIAYGSTAYGPQSISIPMPSSQFTYGYLHVICKLYEYDVLYGYRYIQQD